jgi:hypothetical protein
MSVCLYLIFSPPGHGIHSKLDGKVLFGTLVELDQVALTLGVKALQSFMDNRPPPAGFEASTAPDPKTDMEGFWRWFEAFEKATTEREIAEPWDDWFDPADGLATVTALADRLASDEELQASLPGDVLERELREIARCLLEAQGKGATFRLEAY